MRLTSIVHCIRCSLLPIALVLLSGCRVHVREFHRAAASGDVKALKRYLNNGVDPNYGGQSGKAAYPLHHAAGNGRVEAIKLLVQAGATVDVAGGGGYTPLMSAVDAGEVDAVKQLIKSGANVNYKTRHLETALHRALSRVEVEIVRVLVEAGADVNRKTHQGATPLQTVRGNQRGAVVAGNVEKAQKYAEIIELLEAKGAK